MALPTIDQSSFYGFVNITQDSFVQTDLNDYIARGIVKHIRYLLGDQAYVTIRDNIKAAYTALFAGTDWVNADGDTLVSDSLTDVLRMMIYADWVNESAFINTSTGPVMNFNENATGPVGMMGGALSVARLAEASRQWVNSICGFVEYYRSVSEEVLSVDNTDPLNPICTVSNAIYLEDGDTVTLLGVAYSASSVTATTFVVTVATSGLGSSFVGEDAVWEPFGDVQDNLPVIEVGFA